MDLLNLASGDSQNDTSPRQQLKNDGKHELSSNVQSHIPQEETMENITPQTIENNEVKLTDRIMQCKNIIESLKIELDEEKAKLEREATQKCVKPDLYKGSTSDNYYTDVCSTNNVYTSCVDDKLDCDDNIMAYEQQLQRYQQTLSMAQFEKKNAIRKQMLTKAYRLKLLEVENQCNIELLRVKQSLQCLEPLQMIANKWKLGENNSTYDCTNYQLIPRYSEIKANSGSDINLCNNEIDIGRSGVSGTNNTY